jgi:STIP1 family protein 1
MEEPAVSEDGFTYEKKVLEEHFRLKGPIEPITRRKVEGRVFPNHALKQATEEFLKQNPWAFEEEKGEDFNLIPFI